MYELNSKKWKNPELLTNRKRLFYLDDLYRFRSVGIIGEVKGILITESNNTI